MGAAKKAKDRKGPHANVAPVAPGPWPGGVTVTVTVQVQVRANSGDYLGNHTTKVILFAYLIESGGENHIMIISSSLREKALRSLFLFFRSSLINLFIYLTNLGSGLSSVDHDSSAPRILEKSWVNPNLRRKGPKRVSGSGGVV